MSAFALEDGVVYHTYSTYVPGVDALSGCTRDSTARPMDATRPEVPGGAGTTSTTSAERSAYRARSAERCSRSSSRKLAFALHT
jgi:hypothetical protein